jgi:N-acetyl-1-D-myo-inositol-2-amino-2-deoxy-alpha-D-glucopyranoside deacetylase
VGLAESATFRPDLGPAWSVEKLYWTAMPRSVILAGIEELKALGMDDEFTAMDPEDIDFACLDDVVTTMIDGRDKLPRKMAALAAHATQVNVRGGFFALSNNLGSQGFGVEYFRLVRGGDRGGYSITDPETDLFTGISSG